MLVHWNRLSSIKRSTVTVFQRLLQFSTSEKCETDLVIITNSMWHNCWAIITGLGQTSSTLCGKQQRIKAVTSHHWRSHRLTPHALHQYVYILQTVHYNFSKVRTRRISLTIKNLTIKNFSSWIISFIPMTFMFDSGVKL